MDARLNRASPERYGIISPFPSLRIPVPVVFASPQLFYGRKHWYLFPPSWNLMGKKQVLDWVEHDLQGLIDEGHEMVECVQYQGDILVVPELWGHAVLNLQDSVAVASEVGALVERSAGPPTDSFASGKKN
jgi:hypothetical protein